MIIPISIPKYFIYDILYSSENEIVIISPWEHEFEYKLLENDVYIDFKKYENNVKGSGNHSYVYRCKTGNFKSEIKLLINNKEEITTKVNKYPMFKDKTIISTLVKNEDNYIIQWIEFHLNLGIEHFIIYDNKESIHLENDYKKTDWKWITHDDIRINPQKSNLDILLKDYISKNIVLLINWPYKYAMEKSGVSGLSTQQCHSLYAFRNSYFIGFFDVDEYLNPQKGNNITKLLEDTIKTNNVMYDDIGGITFKCKLFFNPFNKSTNDYNFLNVYNCDNFTPWPHRVKNFAIPKNVNTWCVHMMSNGKSTININENIAYFNHYFYLNKKERGRNNLGLQDSSISRIVNLLKNK